MDKNRFISEVVLGWMKHDLLRMIKAIPPSSNEVGNIYFPLALCVLCYMESLGGFLIGKDEGFMKNVNRYLKDCFANSEEYPVYILNDLIRNGLAHDYFPRGAVSRNGKHPAIYKGLTYDVVLDVETLVSDFIDSLDLFAEKLTDNAYQLRTNEARFKVEELHNKHSVFIQKLKHQPNDDNCVMPSRGFEELEESTHPAPYNNRGAN